MSNDIPYAAGVEYGYHPLSGMHPQAAIHCDDWQTSQTSLACGLCGSGLDCMMLHNLFD
jgi:hypothetical protein